MSAQTLPIVRTVAALRDQVRAWRAAGETVAMTPTMGALHEGDLSLWDGSETLNDIVSPGQTTARYVRYNDSFALRSGDLKWRVRLSLYKNDDAEQPYKVTFHNVMTDEKDQPVELKHHAAGYLWIEPNHHVTHSAAQGHEFALRDRESKERLAVSVHALGRDEL